MSTLYFIEIGFKPKLFTDQWFSMTELKSFSTTIFKFSGLKKICYFKTIVPKIFVLWSFTFMVVTGFIMG